MRTIDRYFLPPPPPGNYREATRLDYLFIFRRHARFVENIRYWLFPPRLRRNQTSQLNYISALPQK